MFKQIEFQGKFEMLEVQKKHDKINCQTISTTGKNKHK